MGSHPPPPAPWPPVLPACKSAMREHAWKGSLWAQAQRGQARPGRARLTRWRVGVLVNVMLAARHVGSPDSLGCTATGGHAATERGMRRQMHSSMLDEWGAPLYRLSPVLFMALAYRIPVYVASIRTVSGCRQVGASPARKPLVRRRGTSPAESGAPVGRNNVNGPAAGREPGQPVIPSCPSHARC